MTATGNPTAVAARAMSWANANYPESSIERRAAFANGVALLVTGESGGYGGPSIREHAIARQKKDRALWDEISAIALAAPIAFGLLDVDLARTIAASSPCRDDDPADLEQLEVSPDVAAIIAAWQSGDHPKALALTKLWEAHQEVRYCVVPGCGKRLSRSNKSGYCLPHRNKGPRRSKKSQTKHTK